MLSTGGMLDYAKHAQPGTTAIMATEVGMLHPLQMAAPDVDFVAANEAASCRYMKMITLPKLRDALRDGRARRQGSGRHRRACAGADRADGGDRALARRPSIRMSPALVTARMLRAASGRSVDLLVVDVAGARGRLDAVDGVGHDELDVARAGVARRAVSARPERHAHVAGGGVRVDVVGADAARPHVACAGGPAGAPGCVRR